jgi:hypothetical protein
MVTISLCKKVTAPTEQCTVDCVQDPVFVNLLCSPGINSQPGGPVRQSYLTNRPARLHRLAESSPGLLNRNKFVLRIQMNVKT